MSWIEGPPPEDPVIDWNSKLEQDLKGELSEDVAKKTLGKFLMNNIGFTTEILTGITLEPYQRIMIKGWMNKNYTLTVAGRGMAKSTLAAIFSFLYCIFNPGVKIVIISATFRSSRRILETIDGWASNEESGVLLRQCFERPMQKAQDLYSITFGNGKRAPSTITAYPLGNPDKLRGIRCNVLIIDEGLLIPKTTIDDVLKPFLFAGPAITYKQRIRERESDMIKAGRLREDQRMQFKSSSKMIVLSSASYKWEYLHDLYQDYLKKIDEATAKGGVQDATYLVQQFSYEIIPENRMDVLLEPAVIKDITSGSTTQATLDREYRAIFTDGTDGYYSPLKMAQCTIPNGEIPCIEITGEKGATYILGIDPNVSASPTSDHFAMCLLKEVTKSDGTKIPMVVHQYGHTGCETRYHMQYFLYLLNNFNIVYIAVDTTQGSGMDFINFCNESQVFKEAKIELLPIEADFGRNDFSSIAGQIRRSYNLQGRRIVQKQTFHSDFQRAGNEHLKVCIDFRKILFAGLIKAVPNVAGIMAEHDIGNIYRDHPAFATEKREGTIAQFLDYQDYMMDLVKKECAMIEPKISPLGNQTFDMPQNMKRTKGANRPRKDNYSALFLANWAFKLYNESRSMPDTAGDNYFEPMLF